MAKPTTKDVFARRTSYPWNEWLDGQIWELTAGKDFEVAIETMRGTVISTINRRGKASRTKIDGEKLYIQAVERNGESHN